MRIRVALTSPNPIINAAAVDAVLAGLRAALARVSSPGSPRRAAIGAPIALAAGVVSPGPSSARASSAPSAPVPSSGRPPSVNPSAASAAIPATPASAPAATLARPPPALAAAGETL